MAELNYDNNWMYLNKLITDKILDTLPTRCYYAQVLVSDGYFANVKLVTQESTLVPIMGVPILQSKYDHPITKPGDKGLLLNVAQNIGGLIEGKKTDMQKTDYFVFLPLITKSEYKGDPLHRLISSPSLKTFFKLGDDGIVLEATTTISGKAQTLKFEGETKITGNTSVTGDTEITGNTSVTGDVEISGSLSVEGPQIAIKGSAPLEIGTSKTIGYLIDAIVTELMSFKTIPAALGSPLTGDPGFIESMVKLKAEIATILKT